jgi:hypothetical protein
MAVAVLQLGLVMPDGQQLDALAPPCRGQLGELLDGGTVASLVQAQEQPRVEHPAGLGGGQLLSLPDDDRHQELEQRPEPLLLAGGGVQVQGAVGPGQQLINVKVAAVRAGGHGGVAVDVQQRLGRAIHRAQGVLRSAGAGRPGIQGLLVADLHQRGGHVVHVLDIDPAGQVGHGTAGARGCEQQDG